MLNPLFLLITKFSRHTAVPASATVAGQRKKDTFDAERQSWLETSELLIMEILSELVPEGAESGAT
jgi:hypothetical protein